jgi:hypothetical protein
MGFALGEFVFETPQLGARCFSFLGKSGLRPLPRLLGLPGNLTHLEISRLFGFAKNASGLAFCFLDLALCHDIPQEVATENPNADDDNQNDHEYNTT